VAAGGKLLLSSLQPHVLEVFSLSGLGQLFQIAECRTVAVHDMTTQTYEDERKTSISCMSLIACIGAFPERTLTMVIDCHVAAHGTADAPMQACLFALGVPPDVPSIAPRKNLS
jgi:hypothetical protein